MKKILFIVLFIFACILLANDKLLPVEAEQIKVQFAKKPSGNPINVKVYANTNDGQSAATPVFNAVGKTGTGNFNFDLNKASNVKFCIDRYYYNSMKETLCKSFTTTNLHKNSIMNNDWPLVVLSIPCKEWRDCPIEDMPRGVNPSPSRLANCDELWAGCKGFPDINPRHWFD